MTALFFFSQRLSAQCDKLPFAYTINGCTVTFYSTDTTPPIPSPLYLDFGDGTTGSGDPVTHVYLSNGTYSVTASYTGFSGTYTCTQTFTLTGCNMTCCSAAFSGQVTRDCGVLFLSLTSECSNGTHSWSVATVPAGECFTLVGFNSAMASQTVQLTNMKKLYLNPELANSQASLQAFMAVKNASSMAQLSQIAIKADSLCLPTAAQKNALDYNAQSLSGLLAQLSLVDSTLRDSAVQLTPQTWLESANERMSLLLQIDNLQAQNEALDSEIDQARLSGAPALIHQLESINPANIYETNEKTVLDFFLRYIIQGGEPDSASLAELSVIASECIFEGGPAVDDARYLYAGFTGILLPEAECAYGERRGRTNQSLFEQSGLTIYPNPADEQIFINLGGIEISESDEVQVSVFNNLGQIVLKTQFSMQEGNINISVLPAGVYQLILENAGNVIGTRLFAINR